MKDFDFSIDTEIYNNRSSLKDSYRPDIIVGRDDELEAYHNALLPVVHDEEPDNIFLYGKAGIGKTACTELIMSELEVACDKHDLSVSIASINCKSLSTSYQVAVRLTNKLRSPENQLSKSGYGESTVFEMLFEEMESRGGTTLLVLDEIDSMDSDSLNKLFYRLSRARSNNDLENAKVGTVCISGDLTLRDKLATDVQSTLTEKSIEFDPYDAEELRDILQQRCEVAFNENALADSVIPAAAAFGAQDGGDARKSLDLLRESGDIARQETADIVSEEHLQQAKKTIEKEQIISTIKESSEHAKITMYAIASLIAGGNKKPESSDVYARYDEFARGSGLTHRSVREFLKEFSDMNITDSESQYGGNKGNRKVHQLNYDTADVLAALSDTIEQCGVHEDIRHIDTVQSLIG